MDPSIEMSHEFLLRPALEEYSLLDQRNIKTIYANYNNFEKLNTCPPLNDNSKSNSLSLKSRKRGNELFVKKVLSNETLIAYNESIAYAECTNDTEFLSISFANRSALLYEMGYFKDCIQDIERARSYNYPKHLLPKLEKRYQLAKENETNSKVFTFHKVIPTLKSSPHKFLKCASDAIEIKCNNLYGRNVIATQDINVGDVLSIEDPYAKYLFHENRHEYCNYCFDKTLSLIPCNYCCDAMFCNEICKNNAWAKGIHKYICKLSTSIVNTYDRSVVIAFYAAIQDLHDAVKKKIEKQPCSFTDAKVYGLTIRNGVIVHDTEPDLSIYSVLGSKDVILGRHCSDVASLLRLIEKKTAIFSDFQCHFTAEDLKRKLIDFTYSHISVFFPMTVGSSNDNQLGNAMLPFNKMINHSCFPNVSVIYYGSTAVLRCLRPIKSQHGLFFSYWNNDYTTIGTDIRQAQLYSAFNFKCKCVACVGNWPTKVSSVKSAILFLLSDGSSVTTAVLSKLIEEKYLEIPEEGMLFKNINKKLKIRLKSHPPDEESVAVIKLCTRYLFSLGNKHSL